MKWNFDSRGEVIAALKQTRGRLRPTYEVLICAGRQGYTNTGIGFYENIAVGHEFSASGPNSAAYAFAYDLGYSFRPRGWKRDPDTSMIHKSSAATAQYFRERAANMMGNSPEVLIMRSFWGATLGRESRKDASVSALKAIKRAPNWADAYYWLGSAAECYALTFKMDLVNDRLKLGTKEGDEAKAEMVRLAHLTLRAYDKAERLDPALHPILLLDRASAYNIIADKESAEMIPLLTDAYLKAFPDYADHIVELGQTVPQWRAMWRKRAKQILAEADA
jgi:hypothetical protein